MNKKNRETPLLLVRAGQLLIMWVGLITCFYVFAQDEDGASFTATELAMASDGQPVQIDQSVQAREANQAMQTQFEQPAQVEQPEAGQGSQSQLLGSQIPIFEGIDTSLHDPLQLRDPFKQPDMRSREKVPLVEKRAYWVSDGVMTNVGGDFDPKTIDFYSLNIIGVLLGPERRVMAKFQGGNVILREGMKFGPNGETELKAILPRGIVLVEQIKNVYNQDEYIETVIPIQSSQQNKPSP